MQNYLIGTFSYHQLDQCSIWLNSIEFAFFWPKKPQPEISKKTNFLVVLIPFDRKKKKILAWKKKYFFFGKNFLGFDRGQKTRYSRISQVFFRGKNKSFVFLFLFGVKSTIQKSHVQFSHYYKGDTVIVEDQRGNHIFNTKFF